MRSFRKVAVSVGIMAVISAPVIAAVAPTGATTMSKEAVKAIGSRMREGVMMKLGKRINKKGVELAQAGGSFGAAGGWTVQPAAGVGASAGAGAGAGAAGAAAGAGAAGATAMGGIGVGAVAAAAGVAAAAAVGVAVAASTSSSNSSPIISVSP